MNSHLLRTPTFARLTRAAALALGAGAVALAGCSSGPAIAPSTQAAENPPAVSARQRNDPIAIEQHWLLSFFKGTPVEIVRTDDNVLTVTVPAEFCFDAGSATIKPPLAKVLEKVAKSLRRRPLLLVAAVEAPTDPEASRELAIKRGQAVLHWLRSHGIDRRRFGSVDAAAGGEVRLRLQWGASPA